MSATPPDQPTHTAPEPSRFDALLPPEIAARAEDIGAAKAALPTVPLLMLSVLAGAFIALGAVLFTTVMTGAGGLPWGIARLLGGASFCLGLILVVVAGAELFTGNNLLIMALVSGKIRLRAVLRNWGLVYAGNFLGAAATAALMFLTGQFMMARGQVGLAALTIAHEKCRLDWIEAFSRGVLCNALVCLAVWLCLSCRSTTDRILAILFPITAFVAAGFEHSIANMYFVPIGLMIRDLAPDALWSTIGATPDAFPALTWGRFIAANLVPVTLGNVVGGAGLVGMVYWLIYRRSA